MKAWLFAVALSVMPVGALALRFWADVRADMPLAVVAAVATL